MSPTEDFEKRKHMCMSITRCGSYVQPTRYVRSDVEHEARGRRQTEQRRWNRTVSEDSTRKSMLANRARTASRRVRGRRRTGHSISDAKQRKNEQEHAGQRANPTDQTECDAKGRKQAQEHVRQADRNSWPTRLANQNLNKMRCRVYDPSPPGGRDRAP